MMQQARSILLSLINSALHDDGRAFPFSDVTADRWNAVLGLSGRHNVLALTYSVVENLPDELRPPKPVLIKWAVLAQQSIDRYRNMEQTISFLADFWASNGIRTMLLKGWGMSLYYPRPELRTFSDMDVYNFGDEARADELVGSRLGISVSGDEIHHTTFVVNGILVENHFDFINTVYHKSNKSYEALLKSAANSGFKTATVAGAEVFLPSARFNALFMMRHMAQHYAVERISLRHLTDWMMFLRAEHSNIDFDELNIIYEKFNMRRFANAVNGILIEYFGMQPDILPCFERDKELEKRILEDVINPAFTSKRPAKGLLRIVWWKTRRYFANRWKHKLIFNESWIITFFRSSYAHLKTPKTITR